MTEIRVKAVIIGAGAVGCATAYELAARGREPLVLERGPRIAEGVTSRNSGVIHAGLYYPPGSLKAAACVRGNALLYEWCEARGVPHRKTGKWIVGQQEDEGALFDLLENARTSGATGLTSVGRSRELSALEGVIVKIGLFSPNSGIVDPYELSRSFQLAAEEKGAEFLLNAAVTGIERTPSGNYRLATTRGEIETDVVVNSAGLYADQIAAMVGITKYRVYPWRGDYFRLSTKHRYPHLIYPLRKKGAAGLGVHLTLGLDGSYRLGPDVRLAETKEDFSEPKDTAAKRDAFFTAASRYLAGIRPEQLSYESCGIRPKLRSPEDQDEKDFVLSEDLPGFVNLVGIESPGLTAARDLALRVAGLLA